MSKIITSPSKKWPGSVTISDPLTVPQTMAYEEAMAKGRELALERGDTLHVEGEDTDRINVMSSRYFYDILPGVCACVEKWELDNLPANITAETFPGSPRLASARLLGWLITEISKLYSEADDLPNA